MNSISKIEEYYNWLLDNPKKAPKKILAVYKKLVDDVHNGKVVEYLNKQTGEMETKTYIFDEARANRPIEFIERFCKHSKGEWAHKPVLLELWQKAHIEALYGFVDKETGLRKYRKLILFVGKKNGKSTEMSGLGLYGTSSDGEGGAEVYSLAKAKDQAKLIWTEACHMVQKSPALKKRLDVRINGIFYRKQDSQFIPLASKTDTLDGKNAYYVLADEIWSWDDLTLLSIMEDGTSAREQPIVFETSTMGTVRESVFDKEYEYAERIIKGYEGQEGGIVDETVLPIIYELDDISEWLDEECWWKANPNLTVSKKIEYLRTKVQKAKNSPIELSNLLCKDFNVRQTSSQAWLAYEELNNESKYNEDEHRDLYCLGGCDLSSTTDLTCATLLWLKDGLFYVKQMYWIPEDYLQKKVNEDKIPYDKWKELGWLRTCEGSKVNYSDITAWFNEQVEKYGLRPLYIGYDRWSASYWCDEMKDYGYDMVEVIQGAKTMSQPMKYMRALLNEKKINYNNNPILKWCLSNMSIKQDENENIRPIKDKSTQRIDGAVSLIDAMVVYLDKKQEIESVM